MAGCRCRSSHPKTLVSLLALLRLVRNFTIYKIVTKGDRCKCGDNCSIINSFLESTHLLSLKNLIPIFPEYANMKSYLSINQTVTTLSDWGQSFMDSSNQLATSVLPGKEEGIALLSSPSLLLLYLSFLGDACLIFLCDCDLTRASRSLAL